MMTTPLLMALGIATAAGLMRGFAGVGSGMMMAPVFAILFGPVDTVGIIILMELVVTAQLLPGTHRDIAWRTIGPMGAAAALFMPLGSWLLISMDADFVARSMAAVVLVFSAVLMLGWRYEGEKRLPATLGVGALSGVLMAATSLGNPPVMMYLLSSRDAAAVNRANFTGYFALTLVALILLMSFTSLLSFTAIKTAAIMLPVFMIGAWIGGRLFRQSSEALYRRVALLILMAIGIFGILR